MREQLSLMVGGQQGEGIDSTGVVLANVLNRLGYQIYGQRTFSSRIKGGHTNFKIRVARRRVLSLE
ncbi:MAG TPA: 2-oxoacid:acceptor oxidoreductase family protein, partial [Sphingobacteriaceae bacterium]|nr:2-oxoacid:acceptor oxidoreductase family protein [Sphingobacteriaceae bacterium]